MDDCPPTRKQEQLISKLLKDSPAAKELDEYIDDTEYKIKANASAFISAERLTSHGLFGDEDGIDLEKAMAELNSYTGNVWTHIISLRRRTPPVWVTTTPRLGATSSAPTAMTSRRR